MNAKQLEAGYRVALKRIIRAATGHCNNETSTSILEAKVFRIAKESPAIVARGADHWFRHAAWTWERGNNSGNNRIREECDALCENYRARAEKIMTLFDVQVDYPGLYPSFKVNGFDHHSALSAIKAATP